MAEEKKEQKPITGNVYKINEKYKGELIDGQFPISKVDVDIIQTLITVCYNSGADEIGDILTSYKTLATDQQILGDLREMASRGMGGEKDQYKNKIYKDMLDINGVLIDIRFVSVIEPKDEYDMKKGRMDYGLLINRDPTEKLFHCNTYISCGSFENRNELLGGIKEKLKKYTFIRIL